MSPVLTLSSLSTVEQAGMNLLSGTPQTANTPFKIRRSLTWGRERHAYLGGTPQCHSFCPNVGEAAAVGISSCLFPSTQIPWEEKV